jgi:tRNA uridine 5-carboxymethylaminomethyl modification enzyme
VEPEDANPILEAAGERPIREATRLSDLARRPGVSLEALLATAGSASADGHGTWAAIELKYGGYIARDRAAAARARRMEDVALPKIDYAAVRTISFEAREKLARIVPLTLGQASRIPGVSPSDVQGLIMEIARGVSRETGGPVRT